jgi:hypothetical protein
LTKVTFLRHAMQHNAKVAAAFAVQFIVPVVRWSLFFLVPVGCLGIRFSYRSLVAVAAETVFAPAAY